MKHLPIVIIIFLIACHSNKHIPKTNSTQIAIQSKLDSIRIINQVPGINFSLIKHDGNQMDFSSGFEDLQSKKKLRTDHSMFSGSIGKTYAVAILMQLVKDNKVQLQDKILDHFPDIEWMHQLPNIQDITVEMLLQHTSGLPRYVLKPAIWDSLHHNPNKIWSYKDRLSHVFHDDPVHEAGKAWAYSDTNYILVGMLIEQITGNDYYEEVQNRIIDAYQLKNTYPSVKRSIPNLAEGWSELPPSFLIPNQVVSDGLYCFNPQMEWTGGGMASSTADLARWAKLYYEGSMVDNALLQHMITTNPNGKRVMGSHDYGTGSFIYYLDNGMAYGHSGFMPGYNSIFAYLPVQKLAIALQVNCDYAGKKMPLTEYIDQLIEIVISH